MKKFAILLACLTTLTACQQTSSTRHARSPASESGTAKGGYSRVETGSSMSSYYSGMDRSYSTTAGISASGDRSAGSIEDASGSVSGTSVGNRTGTDRGNLGGPGTGNYSSESSSSISGNVSTSDQSDNIDLSVPEPLISPELSTGTVTTPNSVTDEAINQSDTSSIQQRTDDELSAIQSSTGNAAVSGELQTGQGTPGVYGEVGASTGKSQGTSSSSAVGAQGAQGSPGQMESAADRTLTQSIWSSLKVRPDGSSTTSSLNLDKVKITSHNGVVTLRGFVSSESEKKMIESRVKAMKNVRTIDNQLQVGSGQGPGSSGTSNQPLNQSDSSGQGQLDTTPR
jgi:hypothetical protein